MADKIENVPLEQLIEEQIAILQSEKTTPEQVRIAFFRMQQYKPLRLLLDQQKDAIAANLSNTEEVRKIFLTVLQKEQALAAKEPEALDSPRSPAEVAARARAFVEAENKTSNAIKTKLPSLEKNRTTYARRVAAAWVEALRKEGREMPSEPIVEKVVAATDQLPVATTKEATQTLLASTIITAIENDTDLRPHQEALRAVTKAVEPPEDFMLAAQIREQTNRIILDSPDITRPDLLVAFIAQGVETTKAVSLTRVAEGLSLDINPTIDPTRPSVFFRAVASTGLQKLAAPAADAILTVLPQGTREQVIESVLTKSWERVTEKLDEKFGTAVVSSPLFKEALAHGNQTFAKPTAPGGAAGGVSKALGDVFGSVFGTGIDQAMINKYLELGKRTPVTPGQTITTGQVTFLQFYAAFANEHSPSLFSPAFAGGKWALGFAGRKIVGAAAKAAATKISGTAIGAAIGTAIPIPIIGNLIGAAVGWIGGKVIGGALNAAKSLFGFIPRLLSGEPGRWQDDFPLVAAGVVLLPIIVLFLLPTFLNPQYVGSTSQASALADTQGGIGTGGPAIDCAKTPDIPECKLTQCTGDCRWPLDTSTHACISEGPFAGTHSNCKLTAVDFLTPGNQGRLFGAPVYTQYAGTITSSVFGFIDNSGYFGNQDGGTYGNHVRVRTDNGGNLLFAHLRNIQVVKTGDRVPAGTVVGFVDHTGYSGGTHLHYEDYGPGCPRNPGPDINRFLPFPVPPCGSVADCKAKLQQLGHPSCL